MHIDVIFMRKIRRYVGRMSRPFVVCHLSVRPSVCNVVVPYSEISTFCHFYIIYTVSQKQICQNKFPPTLISFGR